jgi:predicted Ser/Thr protein kinase
MVTGRGAAPSAREPRRLPTREELRPRERRVIHPGSATKASVLVIEWEQGPVLIKDVRPLHALVRATYGRGVLRREERALAALAGAPGVPRLLGRIDQDALAIEYLEAEPLRRNLGPERLRRACIALGPRVDELHARGVVHLDLRQKRNILVDAAGEVFLIDFQSAMVLAPGGWRGFLLRILAPLDRGAVLKFRARYVPDLLSDAERARARRARLLGRLWIFHRFGPLLRWLFGRSRVRSP